MRRLSAVLLGASLAVLGCGGPSVVQPMPFNHQIHLTKAGLECDSCHEHVTDAPHAGLPTLKVCMGCHRSVTPESPAGAAQVEAMRKLAASKGQLAWVQLYTLPRHVYFSHQRHVTVAELECKACHGDMAQLKAPPERPIARTLQMENCLVCHEARKVTRDCDACHR